MGSFILNCDRTKMKAFIVSALLGLAAADVGHHATISHGGVVHSSGHFAPHVGPAVVSHAAPVAVAHAVHAPLTHAVHAPVVAHPVAHAVHAAPVVAHAVHTAPVVAHAAPAYKAEVYPDEVSPYTFTYAVADDYSKAKFNAEEASDGASNVQGSYSVALPDGRIQHVKYVSNGYDGYVADVTYEGTAVYPEAKPYAAPAPAYHA